MDCFKLQKKFIIVFNFWKILNHDAHRHSTPLTRNVVIQCISSPLRRTVGVLSTCSLSFIQLLLQFLPMNNNTNLCKTQHISSFCQHLVLHVLVHGLSWQSVHLKIPLHPSLYYMLMFLFIVRFPNKTHLSILITFLLLFIVQVLLSYSIMLRCPLY